jgi:polyferredoxin
VALDHGVSHPVVFYGLPWLQWGERQMVLFDLGARRFYIFGLVLYPQDFIYLTGLLIISALFFCSRRWPGVCGAAFPVRRRSIPRSSCGSSSKVEGDRSARMRLDNGPWTFEKIWKKSLKQFLWITVSFWTGFTFVGYFVPIRELGGELMACREAGRFSGCFLRLGHLRQRRLLARAGLQVHVSLCALSRCSTTTP